jgi:pimeloyl-ACP methyl ester carboxylesterase
MADSDSHVITVPGEPEPVKIAVLHRPPTAGKATVMWLSGFHSDMRGTKASTLRQWTASRGLGFLALDYSGHGESGGRFIDGTIGAWLAQTRAVFDWAGANPVIIVGSSMGGWIALLLARQLLGAPGSTSSSSRSRLAGLALIAPAWNMTDLIWASMPEEARDLMMSDGVVVRPSDYDDRGYPITRRLIEEGHTHALGPNEVFRTGCAVHIVQGMRDADVPWQHALNLIDRLETDDARLTLIRDGVHQLSRPQDLAVLFAAIDMLVPAAQPGSDPVSAA